MLGIGATIGKIFGTEKALTAVIDNVSSGLGKLIYTEEEKAGDAARDRAAARAMVIQWMESTKGQNLARRVIALSIVAVWLFQYLSCMALSVAGIWVSESEKVIQSAEIVGASAERLNSPIMLILAFYFAAPHMAGITTAALNKWKGDINKKSS
jgi:hypothetical protein